MGNDNCKTKRENLKFRDMVRLTLYIWRYLSHSLEWQSITDTPWDDINFLTGTHFNNRIFHCNSNSTVSFGSYSLQWSHNGRDGASNHQPHDCLLKRLFRRKSKKTSKPASLAFVWEIHRWTLNSLHKWPVTRKMFPCDDVIMLKSIYCNRMSQMIKPR